MLRALGHTGIRTYHMNEGHSALLTLALLNERTEGGLKVATAADRETIRQKCVFTTHTPVPAGHDNFPPDMVQRVMGEDQANILKGSDCCPTGTLNMTYLALYFSRYINPPVPIANRIGCSRCPPQTVWPRLLCEWLDVPYLLSLSPGRNDVYA